MNFIKRNKLDSFVLTYHDLTKKTEQKVEEMMSWVGVEYEPTQLEYWNFEHHGTQKHEYQWIKKEKTRHFDLRWKSFLSEDVQNGI
jgi:hypothetical protein